MGHVGEKSILILPLTSGDSWQLKDVFCLVRVIERTVFFGDDAFVPPSLLTKSNHWGHERKKYHPMLKSTRNRRKGVTSRTQKLSCSYWNGVVGGNRQQPQPHSNMSPWGAPIKLLKSGYKHCKNSVKHLEDKVISIQHEVSALADHVNLMAQNPQKKNRDGT